MSDVVKKPVEKPINNIDSDIKNAIIIRKYLQNYNEYTTFIANVKRDLSEERALLSIGIAPKVSQMSNAPGSDGLNHSQQETYCIEKTPAIEKKIAKLENDLKKIEPIMIRLNKSLESLTELDNRLIRDKWIYNFTWRVVAKGQQCSRCTAIRSSARIIDSLAIMVFGE